MENEQLDLTLRLGQPIPTVDTHLTLATTANTNQRSSVVGGRDNNNIDVNTRVYNIVFQHFAGTGETLNFATFSMPPCPAPAPVIPPVSYPGGRIEVARKCANKNCNAIDTPLWRRGPLGPKSLCNACGIKFRKEEERRAKRN